MKPTFSTEICCPCSSVLCRCAIHLATSVLEDIVTMPQHFAPGLRAFVTTFAPSTYANRKNLGSERDISTKEAMVFQ